MSTEEENVRPSNLPAINPEANYPRAGLVGRTISFTGSADMYKDLRGPILTDVKPVPNVPLNVKAYYRHKNEIELARASLEGTGYSPYGQQVDAQGFSIFSGPIPEIRPAPSS